MTCTDLSLTRVSGADFRHAIGHFATGVTVVTSVGPHGAPVGTTANAVSGAFAVNVLAAPQQHLSANFARRGLAAAWEGVRHRRGLTGSPRLEGVLASLECTVEHRLDGGDHEIVVGRVREVETSGADVAPLLFWRGAYASLGQA